MNVQNIGGKKVNWLTALSLTLAFGTGVTVAGERSDDSLPAITVKYDAVEAARPAGAAALYKRIQSAAS